MISKYPAHDHSCRASKSKMRRAACFPSLSTTYILPAVLLNPPVLLHLINTFISHFLQSTPSVSVSPHPRLESLGPVPGSKPYFDMHANDQLCWHYTAFIVVVQLLAMGSVQDNRRKRKGRLQRLVQNEIIEKALMEEARHAAFIEGYVESGRVHLQAVNGQDTCSLSTRVWSA
jgi:hypothetical protein